MSSTQDQLLNDPTYDEPLLGLSEVLQSINNSNNSYDECLPIGSLDYYCRYPCRTTEGDRLTQMESTDASKQTGTLLQLPMEAENPMIHGFDCPGMLNSPVVDGTFLRGLEDYPTDVYSFTDYNDVAALASSDWNVQYGSTPNNFSFSATVPAGYNYCNDRNTLGCDYGMYFDIQPISQGYQPYDFIYAETNSGFTPNTQPHIAQCYCGDPINCYFRQGAKSFEATNVPQSNQYRQLYPDGFLPIPANDFWDYNNDYDFKKVPTMFDVKSEDADQTLKWSGTNKEPPIMDPCRNFGNALNQPVERIETLGLTDHVKEEKRSPYVNYDIPKRCAGSGTVTSHVILERLDYQQVRWTGVFFVQISYPSLNAFLYCKINK